MHFREAADSLHRAVMNGRGEFPHASMEDPLSVVGLDALTGVVLGVRREVGRVIKGCPIVHSISQVAGRVVSVAGAIFYAAEGDYPST